MKDSYAEEVTVLSMEINDSIVVTVQDRILNVHNSQDMFQKLEDAVRTHRKDLVLNLELVGSCDSSTIALLVELQNIVNECGRQLTLTNVSPFVKKVLDMLHITRFFKIE